MTDTVETKQRKCEEKIRLYTQLGISSTPSKAPSDTNYEKIRKYFEILSKQNTDINDETSLTYSEFLKEAKGIVNVATNNLIHWSLTIDDNNKHISDSMVDLILPTVFFETGNAKDPKNNKLKFWQQQIGGKYNTLVQKGNDLWDDGNNLAKGSQITPALKRIGAKWELNRIDDAKYLKSYLEDLGFDSIEKRQAFLKAMLRFAPMPEVKDFYFNTSTGMRQQRALDVSFLIKNHIPKEDLLLYLSEAALETGQKTLIEQFYEDD